jgi:UDP-N-acetylmuramoylalanine--D-glutamate ligase
VNVVATGNLQMTAPISLKNYRVIVGMGKTGLSCAEFLRARGLPFCMVDTRAQPPLLEVVHKKFPDVFCQTGHIDPGLLAHAEEILMSPGVSQAENFLQAAKQRQVPLLGDIELFYRAARAPIIAITGSNAKSTVTTLVGEMAKASGVRVAVGGNLGTPALELLDDSVELYVLELSSFQLELVTTFRSKVAAILNISEDHMDRYATLREYVDAKQQIYIHCETAIYNAQDKLTRPADSILCKAHAFTLGKAEAGSYGLQQIDGKAWLAKGEQPLLALEELQLSGMHNVANCLAALAIGDAAGFSLDAMLSVLRTFSGLPHRCQLVETLGNVRYINDSKGTNVGATIAAIEGLVEFQQKNIVLIAGGEGKGADFILLRAACQQAVKACVLIGRDAQLIATAIDDATRIVYAIDMASAVQTASELAAAGDTVLLSPACASFDMFSNYEHRGDCFVQAVQMLAQGERKA